MLRITMAIKMMEDDLWTEKTLFIRFSSYNEGD